MNGIKCFGKKALMKSKQILDNLGDTGEVKQGSFGKIFTEFKHNYKAAKDALIKAKDGEAIAALNHKDIGDIDLVWGKEGTGSSDGYGLAKIVKFHPEIIDDLDEIIKDLPITSRSENRAILQNNQYKAVVSLDYYGKSKQWLLTAFEKKGDINSRGTSNSINPARIDMQGESFAPQTSTNDIIPQSWWQNQVDKAFNKLGAILHKADKGLMNAAKKPTKGALRKAFGDSFVTFSKTYEEVGEMVEDFRNATRQIYSQAAKRRETLDKLLTPDDKVTLHKALGGDMDPKDLPVHLQSLYNNIHKMIDDNAEALIKAGALKEKYKIDDYLKRYYKQHHEEKQGFLSNFFNKKFKARKDLSYDERIALEMIEDSSIVVPNTIAEQRTQLVKANFLKQVADKFGQDAEFEGSVRMSDETVGGGIMKYGALGGKYVPREVADAIKGANILKDNISALEEVWYPIIDHIKVNVTVKNPTTHLYNFGSNVFLSFLHGDMRAVARAIKLSITDKTAWKELIQRAHAQGIVSKLGDFEDG
ncbi:MAG: hypothetical protein LBB59_02730 [Campylobacteraceae bacterium]|jgi:hypothetical protein|nr:hypothetical protein [Campylobacteraceae bacterium]